LHVSDGRKFGRRRIWDSRRVIEGKGVSTGEGMGGKLTLAGVAGEVVDDADGIDFFFAMRISNLRYPLMDTEDLQTAVAMFRIGDKFEDRRFWSVRKYTVGK
jgi:hypothetical protein